MLKNLFGAGTRSAMLRGGLEEASRTQKTIAARIEQASTASSGDFASALSGANAAAAKAPEVDLQQEMVNLADTQLRYEASAKLLQETYSQIRTAIRNG